MENNNENTISKHRYPALRIISGIYKILAWIIGIGTIVTTLSCMFQGDDECLIVAISTLLGGSLLAIGFFAISEFIKVFIDIEYNTRKISEK